MRNLENFVPTVNHATSAVYIPVEARIEIPDHFRIGSNVLTQVFAVVCAVVRREPRVGPGAVVEVVPEPTVPLGHVATPVHVGVEAVRCRPKIIQDQKILWLHT